VKTSEQVFQDQYLYSDFGLGKDNVEEWWGRYPLDEALTKTHIRTNITNLSNVLNIDFDHPYAWDMIRTRAYADQDIPIPNVVVENPKTGHAHLVYVLAEPVVTSRNGGKHAQKFFEAVHGSLREVLGGDPGYTNHSMRSPLCPDHVPHWLVEEAYTLGGLREELGERFNGRLNIPRGNLASLMGSGRHQDLFAEICTWANANHRRFKMYAEFEMATLDKAQELSAKICAEYGKGPLSDKDVEDRAYGAADYAWSSFHSPQAMKAYSERQAHLAGLRAKKVADEITSYSAAFPTQDATTVANVLGRDIRTVRKYLAVPSRQQIAAERMDTVVRLRSEGVPFQVIADTLCITLDAAKALARRAKA
jgi:hypothetical protein